MLNKTLPARWARIYIAGPIDVAKQIIREGLCATITSTPVVRKQASWWA